MLSLGDRKKLGWIPCRAWYDGKIYEILHLEIFYLH